MFAGIASIYFLASFVLTWTSRNILYVADQVSWDEYVKAKLYFMLFSDAASKKYAILDIGSEVQSVKSEFELQLGKFNKCKMEHNLIQ